MSRAGALSGRGTSALIAAYVIAVPFVILPSPIGDRVGAVDLLFPIALIVILRRLGTRVDLSSVLFVVFLGCVFASTIAFLAVSGSPGASTALLAVRLVAIYLPLFLVYGWDQLTEDRLKKYVRLFLFSGGAVTAAGIVMHHAGIQVRSGQQRNWYDGGLQSTLRAGGLLGNTGDFGHLSALLGTVALTFGLVYLKQPLLSASIFIVAAYATYLSSSRAAALHLVVVTICMLPVLLKGRRIIGFAVLAWICAVVALLSFDSEPDPRAMFILRRLDIFNLTGETLFYSSDARVSSWEGMLSIFERNPIFGIGYGRTEVLQSAGDNTFLSLLIEIGLLGGIAFIAMWTLFLVRAFRSPAGDGRVVAIAVVLAEVAHMLTIDTQRMWATTPIALIMVALSLRGPSLLPGVVGDRTTRRRRPRESYATLHSAR